MPLPSSGTTIETKPYGYKKKKKNGILHAHWTAPFVAPGGVGSSDMFYLNFSAWDKNCQYLYIKIYDLTKSLRADMLSGWFRTRQGYVKRAAQRAAQISFSSSLSTAMALKQSPLCLGTPVPGHSSSAPLLLLFPPNPLRRALAGELPGVAITPRPAWAQP